MNTRVQCHFWLTKDDHDFLATLARQREESVGALMRRVVKRIRAQSTAALGKNGELQGSADVNLADARADIPTPVTPNARIGNSGRATSGVIE